MKKIYKLLICVLVLTMFTGCSQATSKRNAKEIIEDMSFHGTINCACGTYGNIHMQLYYTDFPEKDYYVIFRVVMDGKDVYNNPKSVRSFTGMIELTL